MIREVAIYLLRSVEKNPELEDMFPSEIDNILTRLLKILRIGKIFSFFFNRLSGRNKVRIHNILINRFRIIHTFVPPEKLEKKYNEALLYLTRNGKILGDYLEFGVYQGNSLLAMFRTLKNRGLNKMRLFGFDSFEGLPPLTNPGDSKMWYRGQYKADYKFTKERLTKEGVDWDKVFLVKGFFDSTLNKEIINNYKIKKASLIMIDCDIYLSAKQALDFCAPLIHDEAVIFFDDWNFTDYNGGEKRAFTEFLKENPYFTAEEFGTYIPNSQVFVVKRPPPQVLA